MVMNMKDEMKCLGLIAVGLLTAIFLYPFLHELGHVIAAIAVRSDVKGFQLFPLPSVMCEMDVANKFSCIAIGMGGMILPYAISFVVPMKRFWLWYIWLIMSGICLLSFAISIAGVFYFRIGSPIANEDITQIMLFADEYYILYLAILIGLSVFRIIQIVRTRPIRRCMREFDIK